jgi:[pyruvate, water dikinase]-phosphate phosphotransferase / [pyruvate, water dikinase] kinase
MPHRDRVAYVISDSSGETAHHVAEACMEQFTNGSVRIQRITHVRSKEALVAAMHAASELKAIVFYTFVKDDMQEAVRESAHHYGLIAVDVIGPALESVARWLGKEPNHRPGRVIDAHYFARVAARAYAQDHDDGLLPEDLPAADVVLLGLSRSGKTPLMHMLAEYGLRVANVPLTPGVPLLAHIERVDPQKVFVLRVQPDRLRVIRVSRLPDLGLDENDAYVDRMSIREEIRMVEMLLETHPRWRSIDMTRRAVEEAAGEILQMVGPIEV